MTHTVTARLAWPVQWASWHGQCFTPELHAAHPGCADLHAYADCPNGCPYSRAWGSTPTEVHQAATEHVCTRTPTQGGLW